jgi:hypothetical protein
VQSVEPVETITLLPFGALELRLTDFPVLGERARADNNALAFTFDDNTTTGWSWYGGGWWAHDGKLQLTPGSTPGSKALVENFACQNLRMEAEVTPPPKGDAGVVFRVSKPTIGADAYEGYYAGVSSSDNQIILGRASGKAWTPLKIVAHAIAPGRGTTLRVTAVGERIEVRVNDEKAPAISLTDATYVAGQAGVRVYTTDSDHMTAAFDNVRITPLPAAAPPR